MGSAVELKIISLPKDRERLSRLTAALDARKLFYSVIRGWPGEEAALSLEYFGVQSLRPGMSPGEIGCAFSHLDAYRASASEVTFVLEDDVVPNEVIPKLERIAELTRPGDVFLLGVSTKKEYLAGEAKQNGNLKFHKLDLFSIYMLRGACAYAIHSATAERITEVQRRRLYPADAWWRFVRKGAVSRILLLDAFTHPVITLADSNLEGERERQRNSTPLKWRVRRLLKPVATQFSHGIRSILGHELVYPSVDRK